VNRTLCRCADCDSVYVARKPDGDTVQIIGTDAGCTCGSDGDSLEELTSTRLDPADEPFSAS
jgi:hypothetical protein